LLRYFIVGVARDRDGLVRVDQQLELSLSHLPC
jgi:hypothetical protein